MARASQARSRTSPTILSTGVGQVGEDLPLEEAREDAHVRTRVQQGTGDFTADGAPGPRGPGQCALLGVDGWAPQRFPP